MIAFDKPMTIEEAARIARLQGYVEKIGERWIVLVVKKASLVLLALVTLSGCAGIRRYHPCEQNGIETCPDWVRNR